MPTCAADVSVLERRGRILKSSDTLILSSVGTLSNFFRRTDAPSAADDAAPITCRPADREQVHAALRLILSTGGRLADEEAVVDFLQFTIQRHIDLNDLWVANRGGRVAWAALPIVSPGHTMLVLAPPGERLRAADAGEAIAGELLEAVCGHFSARGVQLAQALLDPSDNAARQLYLARAFRQVAELLYLQADVRRTFPAPQLPEGFDWLSYSPAAHETFASTIVQTYRDSLDCPGLNGLRDIEDVIVGHKASGVAFDPSWWFVLRERGEPRAVLLLARTAQAETAELVYLGLVPAARGRGLGDVVMRQALHVVSSSGSSRAGLALAVDAHNAPALRLYHRHGLRRIGSKLAMMRLLREDFSPVAAPTAAAAP
jgi:ribosomal protein S18 acetylase RimI-like enzyme